MSLLYECINTVIAGEWFLLQISLLSFVGFHSFSLLNTENLGIELVYFLLVLFLYTFFYSLFHFVYF